MSWKHVKIGEVCKTGAGGTPLKSKKEFYEGGAIPWLLSGEVSQGEIFASKQFITDEGLQNSSAKIFPKNTVLVAMYGATAGQVGVLRFEASTNQAVCGIYPNDKLLPEFIYYSMLHKQRELIGKATGNAQPNISQIKVKNTDIPLIDREEQKRIVAILDEAFAGIDTAIANTEKNLANARELFESYLNSVFSKKRDGWVERRLGDEDLLKIIDGDRGKNYPKKSDFSGNGFCLFLNTKNVRPDGFNFDKLMFISEEKDKALRKGKLKRRDVIVTTRGTIGNIALYDDSVEFENIRINSGMLIFRPNEQAILSEYLFEMLRSSIVKSQIKRHVSGAAQPQLPIKTLVNFVIPIPANLVEQGQIVEDLQGLYSTVHRLDNIYQEKLNSLNELKQSLLQKAFSGELTAEPGNLKDEAVA